ncbi:MAG: hypothetical protein ABR576_13355 [Thermoanaerobaculia bacterium]
MGSTRRAILSAAGAVASLFAARRTLGQTATPAPRPPTTPAPGGPPTTPAPAEPGPLARAARERFGKFLAPEELKMLDEEMAAVERRGARLKEIPLANGEEPSTDFRVIRS